MPLQEVDGPRFSLLHARLDSTSEDTYAGTCAGGCRVGVCDRSDLVEFESFAVRSFKGCDSFRSLRDRRVGLNDMSVIFETVRGQLMARNTGPAERSDHRFE